MEITIEGYTRNSISIIKIAHPGTVTDLMFSAAGYPPNTNIINRDELFREANLFIGKKPKEWQDQLFEVYRSVGEILDSITDSNTMQDLLAEQVQQLYTLIQFDDLLDYIYSDREIRFPSNLANSYSEQERLTQTYRERTYLKTEYVQLVALTLGLRFMFPIWGAYLPLIGKDQKTVKETKAFNLLNNTSLRDCDTFARLDTYVRANLTDEEASLAVIMAGLSTAEIPNYLLALASIRKLALSPIIPSCDDDHLMKIVYNFVTGNANRLDSRFQYNLCRKANIVDGGEEDNSSVWDAFKMKQEVSEGDQKIIEIFLKDIWGVVLRLEPEMRETVFKACEKNAQNLIELEIEPHHTVLVQWVLSPLITPAAVDSFSINILLPCLAATQAVLWHWGFRELAMLVTAQRFVPDEDEFVQPIVGRSKIRKELVQELDVLYPYSYQETKVNGYTVSANPAIRGIDTLVAELSRHEWQPNGPNALIKEIDYLQATRRHTISGDIKNQLAELLIRIHRLDNASV